MATETDVSSLTHDNNEIIKSFVERIYEGYNLLPNESPIRVDADIAEYYNDQQAIKYLKIHGIILSHTQNNSQFPSHYYVEVEPKKLTDILDALNNQSSNITITTTSISKPKDINFIDNEGPVLMWGNLAVKIPKMSLPYWILKKLFEEFPNHTSIEEVLSDWGREERKNTVSDGITSINKRIRVALETDDTRLALVRQDKGEFRFVKTYIDSISTKK
ncbi:hypothetical protein CVV43_03690 [Candidatus Saccharibacteria bacterium HGW-Saccharibacteria-1]|jgi:hypothetical protein|nr:MAG: hypothetical protein CVV43_03690 [Candidatus Saccharibacteria bacterium HGW-Saccharibacteria-1]